MQKAAETVSKSAQHSMRISVGHGPHGGPVRGQAEAVADRQGAPPSPRPGGVSD